MAAGARAARRRLRARRARPRRAPCCRGAERGGVAGAAGHRRPRVSAAADRDHAGRDGVLRRGARGALSVRAMIAHSPSQSPRAARRTNRCGIARSGSGAPRCNREAAARMRAGSSRYTTRYGKRRTRCRAPNACASSPRGAAGPKRNISSISGRGIETCGASPVRSFANSASTAGAIDALGARRWRRGLACRTGGRTCAPIAHARA